MPKFTLTYFDGRGLAEVARWLFAIADQPYEDVRLSHDGDREEWKKLKPTTPFGQVPVLDVDGFKLCQSASIAAYLADEFGLSGKDNLEHARVHMVYDCLSDVAKGIYPVRSETDATKKAELKKKFEDDLQTAFGYFEKFINDNGSSGYFVGDKLTLADIAFAVSLERIADAEVETHLEKFPKLNHLNDTVRSNPKIAAWIAKRPVTVF